MQNDVKLSTLPNTPAKRACRYEVYLTNGQGFTVFVHRGSVPREAVSKQIAHHETIRNVRRQDGAI